MNGDRDLPPRLAFYGDDFTGSTDVLEFLHLGGVPSVLFLEPPEDPRRWRQQFPEAQAIGVAGVARSLPTEAMAAEIEPSLRFFEKLAPEYFLYKLCSTFDSSPAVGSIGRALELVRRHFPAQLLPLAVAAPSLRRHLIFGNLFAGFGDQVMRLDRHTTMSRHPITPMNEADLRRHLERQSSTPTALVDWLTLRAGPEKVREQFRAWASEQGERNVFIDTLAMEDVERVGLALADLKAALPAGRTLPIAGSSMVAQALASQWRQAGDAGPGEVTPLAEIRPKPVEQLVVMAGSASPQTAAQISRAAQAGWKMIRIKVPDLINPDSTRAEHDRLEREAHHALGKGESVVLFSAQGPDDPALLAGGGAEGQLGQAQGRLLHSILLRSGLRRACVAGGDTSGHVARQLGIFALEFAAVMAPGAPLCRARSHDANFDGIELALKGGQCGAPDYFLKLGHLS